MPKPGSVEHRLLTPSDTKISDTKEDRVEYVIGHFEELVAAFQADYDQVIIPPVAGTDGDIKPLVGLIARIAPLLPNTTFHLLCFDDYERAVQGASWIENVQIHRLGVKQPLSLSKRLAEVTPAGKFGIDHIMDAYTKPMDRESARTDKPQGFLGHLRDEVAQWYEEHLHGNYERTLFLGSMTSYAYIPPTAESQTVTPYIPYLEGEELLSELVFTIWREKWYSGIQALLTRKLMLDATLGSQKVEGATGLGEFMQRTRKPLFTMTENMVRSVTPSGKPTRLERLTVGQVRTIDDNPEETEHTLQVIEQLKSSECRVALFSSSASSLNGNFEYLKVIADTLKTASGGGQQWKLLIPAKNDTQFIRWVKENQLDDIIVPVGYTHHPAVLPEIDLLLASAGVGTVTEALRAAVPSVLFAMPQGAEQHKQADKAADQSKIVEKYGWFKNLLKDKGQLLAMIERVTTADREEAQNIAEAMQLEDELITPEIQLGLILMNVLAESE